MDSKKRFKGTELSGNLASSSNNEGSPSVVGRIGASAASLSQSSFGRPPPGAIAESLATLDGDTSKGEAPSSSGASEAPSFSHAILPRRYDGRSGRQLVGESFRLAQGKDSMTESRAQATFDEFAERPQISESEFQMMEALPVSNGNQQMHSPGIPDLNGIPLFDVRGDLTDGPTQNGEHSHSNSDGAAVVTLLAHPAFAVDEDPAGSRAAQVTQEDEQKLHLLRPDQLPHKSADPLRPINPLDLMPDFNSSWEPVHPSNFFRDLDSSYEGERFSDPAFGDIQPWVDILNRYHDEVWGDMLHLIHEAREEVKAANSSSEGAPQDRPALRRLGMLLKHLNHPL